MQPLAKALLSRPEIAALLMLLAVIAGFSAYAPQFASSGNMRVKSDAERQRSSID